MKIEEFLQDWIDDGKSFPHDVKITGSVVTDPLKFVQHHLKSLAWTRFSLETWAEAAGIWSGDPDSVEEYRGEEA